MAPLRDLAPVAVLSLLLSAGSAPAGPGEGQAEPTLEQIRATFAAARARVHSLSFVADNDGRSLHTPAGVVRRFRTTAAIAPYRRYVEVVHLVPGLDWEDDPEWERSFLTPGHLTVFWVNRRAALVSTKEANPGQNPKLRPVLYEYFLEGTGWWPPEEAGEGRTDWAAPPAQAVHVVLGRTDLRLRKGLERVGGSRCAVVATPDGLDTLWLDVDRGCALVRRHLTNPKERLHACYTNASFREVVPGVWLPWELRRVAHRGRSPGEVPDDELLVFLRATRHIRKLRVNDVPEETFHFQPPPGTAFNNEDRNGANYATPGGIDLLDNSVRIGRKILRLRAAQSPAHEEQGGVVWPVAGVLAGAAVGLAAWLAVRRRRGQARARRLSVSPGPGPAVASVEQPG
jgi:hypothetical protein